MNEPTRRRLARNYPTQLFLLGTSLALPWIGIHLWGAWVSPIPHIHLPPIYLLVVTLNVVVALRLWRACHEPFYNLANMLRSLQQEDYSRRVLSVTSGDALSLVHDELNALADALQANRLANTEHTHRFQSLIDNLEVAVLTVNDDGRIIIANRYVARLLKVSQGDVVGQRLEAFNLDELLVAPSGGTLALSLPARASRFLLLRNDFRESGLPNKLLVLTDLSTPLREEERNAWKRLIRVLGHELNNSLTPIISISDSLGRRLESSALSTGEKASYREGLALVGQRAENLRRFVSDYSRLAKLPPPTPESVAVAELVDRTAAMLPSVRVQVYGGPECQVIADPAQVEQALINLIRNALEATEATGGTVRIHWSREATRLLLRVDDDGPGLSEPDNLFVPFYSTKREGSGIGLVLSRQIAEANNGALTLANRPEGGCRAEMALQLDTRIGG